MLHHTILLLLPVVILVPAVLIQLRLSALGLSPVSFELPELPSLEKNDRLAGVHIEKLGEGDLLYPEAFVTCPRNLCAFISLGDGRVVRLDSDPSDGKYTWEKVRWRIIVRTGGRVISKTRRNSATYKANSQCGKGGPADSNNMEPSCGRPLGLWLSKSRESIDPNFIVGVEKGEKEIGYHNYTKPKLVEDEDVLLVADAYKGLIMVTDCYGYHAELQTLATRANTDPPDYRFSLLNSVLQLENGDVYFTETSQKFQRRRIFYAAMDGTPTGRLLRYRRGEGVEVVAEKLYIANGLALSHDKKSLLIVSGVRILRYDIASETMDSVPFVDVMPGTGDNLKAMDQLPNGKRMKCYWAALGGKYTKPFSLLKLVSDKPRLRALLLAIVPYRKIIDLIPKWTALAVYDEQGNLVETVRDDGDRVDADRKKVGVTVPWVSEMEPLGDYMYLLSWYNPFLARIHRSNFGYPTSPKSVETK